MSTETRHFFYELLTKEGLYTRLYAHHRYDLSAHPPAHRVQPYNVEEKAPCLDLRCCPSLQALP